MDSKQWEKIRTNLDEIRSVYPKTILHILNQKNVLDLDDKEDLLGISVSGDCMEKLCLRLKQKPSSKDAYRSFLDALRETRLPDLISLAEKIEQTETKSDGNVTAKVDPESFEKRAREIFNQHFVDKDGAETPLSDFMDVLRSNDDVFRADSPWNDSYLYSFIKKHFTRAEKVQRPKETGTKQATAYIKNVAKLEATPEETVNPGMSLKISGKSATEADKLFSSLSPTEVRHRLKPRFDDQGIRDQPLFELEKNEISGAILLSLTKDEIQEAAPSLTIGSGKLLRSFIKDFKQPQNAASASSPQSLRKFDLSVQANYVFYIQGKCVKFDTYVHNRKRNACVNCFHLVTDGSEGKKHEFIAVNVLLFVAACVNERRNGIIHFGINHESCQQYGLGEIVGVIIEKDEVRRRVDDILHQAFHKDQMKVIQKIVRPAEFIPVFTKQEHCIQQKECKRYVIEFDIEPSNATLGEKFVKICPKKIPRLQEEYKMTSCIVRFSESGKPKILNFHEEHEFENQRVEIIAERNLHEIKPVEKETQNLHTKLQNLVTGGYSSLDDTIFPLLMLGLPEGCHDDHLLGEIEQLVSVLRPEVVFDFDSSNRFYNALDKKTNMRALTLDNFDPQKCEDYQSFKEGLHAAENCMWVFCNGYKPTNMEYLTTVKWKKQRKRAFQEALDTYLGIFKKDRILLVICIFSPDEWIIGEACDNALLELPDQWILLAESETVQQAWQEQILKRNVVDGIEDIFDRSIVGMTWEQITSCFKDWCRYEEFLTCKIPHSNGSPVEIQEKLLQGWCDVEIISISDPIEPDKDENTHIAKKVEERFYRGNQVEWLNFWFEDQVIKRSIHDAVKNDVEKAMHGNSESSSGQQVISSVLLYHQPGAGGTTVAKQILWDLRKKYRCCVVLNITQDTCNQLEEIYLHKDEHPKPLLILVDNKENDELERLRKGLEIKAGQIHSKCDGASNMFCVILICMRCADLPVTKRKSHMKILRQDLDTHELQGFKTKSNVLKMRFAKNAQENIDPQFLLSFNLLKENFDRKYLRKIVEEYVQKINVEKEIDILKFVSLLNTFDADFTEIPVHFFDVMLQGKTCLFQNTHSSVAYNSRRTKWEASLSASLKILLNISIGNNRHQSRRRAVRIFNQLFASEIFDCIRNKTKQNVSDLMLELIRSEILRQDNKAFEPIYVMVKNILIKRQHKLVKNVLKKEQFSTLLLFVRKEDDDTKAIKILETFYDIRKDAFIAQQITRFYLELKDFTSAEKYAALALKSLPSHSHLLNTSGHVFLKQLRHKAEGQTCQHKQEEELKELIELFTKCRELFKKAQINEYKCQSSPHGYIYELQSIATFLKALKRMDCFVSNVSKEIFHKYLVEDDFNPEELDFLNSTCVKELFEDSQNIQQKLDEIFIYCNSQDVDEFKGSDSNNMKLMFSNVKMDLEEYFGEDNDEPPSHLSEKEKCAFRFRRVKSKGVKFLKYLLKVTDDDQQLEKYNESCSLLWDNVHGRFCGFRDLKAMLDIVTVLMINGKLPSHIPYIQILQWSLKLCSEYPPEVSKEDKSFVHWWYYVIFHFPTPERILEMQVPSKQPDCNTLLDVLQKWQLDCDSTSKTQCQNVTKHDRENLLLCLGNGKPLEDLVYCGDCTKETNIEEFLLSKKEKLRYMSGTLKEGGKNIQFFFTWDEKTKHSYSIPTLHYINKKYLWQKKVYFYLGFCQFGLKAYCVTDHKGL